MTLARREWLSQVLNSEEYRKNLAARMVRGRAGAMEPFAWQLLEPRQDKLEISGPGGTPVPIVVVTVPPEDAA